jgi:hypothetical protein
VLIGAAAAALAFSITSLIYLAARAVKR